MTKYVFNVYLIYAAAYVKKYVRAVYVELLTAIIVATVTKFIILNLGKIIHILSTKWIIKKKKKF